PACRERARDLLRLVLRRLRRDPRGVPRARWEAGADLVVRDAPGSAEPPPARELRRSRRDRHPRSGLWTVDLQGRRASRERLRADRPLVLRCRRPLRDRLPGRLRVPELRTAGDELLRARGPARRRTGGAV